MDISFVKGHGTENDFVLIPDANGKLDLTAEQVVRLCDRRAGIGGDGVIRVVRTDATDDPAAVESRGTARWFMDYRNSDGSVSEMCGNGIRVLGLYLVTHADADPREPLKIATRAGIKVLTFGRADDGELRITVDMGNPQVFEETKVSVGDRSWPATKISMGNPHAVAFVESLEDAGNLYAEPEFDRSVFPDGVNVEFVVRAGDKHLSMRVHERGSGETRSCGTGACAVMVAAAIADEAERGTSYRVDLPGGTLDIVWTDDDRILMTGPAVLVAEGFTSL
ncbi:diaminopimelate epimerase [Marmoricola sp. OAE513]|uniref:diaminopimelate epimerase n=1 Tax=Marmoricola sp. OAE513 TaxID=2817894 RepID=UPI001AE71B07